MEFIIAHNSFSVYVHDLGMNGIICYCVMWLYLSLNNE